MDEAPPVAEAPVAAEEAPAAADTAPVPEGAPAAEANPTEAAPPANGESDISPDQGVELIDTDALDTSLNQQTLEAVAEAAKQRWIDSGLTPEQAAALADISYQIADLGGNQLGLASGSAITIDDDAGGSGSWFIDATPDLDEEFLPATLPSSSSLSATLDGGAFGHYDLLSTILHEQGHVLGLGDLPGSGGDMMNELIDLNARRLPGEAAAGLRTSCVRANQGTGITRAGQLPPNRSADI